MHGPPLPPSDDDDEDDVEAPKAAWDAFMRTQHHAWCAHASFSKCGLRSVVIDLPVSFIAYLGEDGIQLPRQLDGEVDSQEDVNSNGNDNDTDTEEENSRKEAFELLDQQVKNALNELGDNGVFPKLNWSAPLDAVWINGGTLKCTRSSEVYLLLKASDRITFDMEDMLLHASDREDTREQEQQQEQISSHSSSSVFTTATSSSSAAAAAGEAEEAITMTTTHPPKVTLVLKKWANLNPSMEFRLFIKEDKLIGICQRDVTTFYDYLLQENEQDRIVQLIEGFFFDGPSQGFNAEDEKEVEGEGDDENEGQGWITTALGLDSYILDVYIDKKDRVWLIDVNVFGYPTDPLLFRWRELLNSSAEDHCEIKMVTSRKHTRSTVVGAASGPIDVTMAPDFQNFMKIVREQEQEEEGHEEHEGDGGGGDDGK